MRECQIKQESRDGVDVLQLDGSLDSYSFPRLDSMLNTLRTNNRSMIVLDCGNLDYINSAALGALIGFARRAREAGGDLKIAGLNPKVMNIIDLLGFDKILHILPTVNEAVSKFAQTGR
jgi:anti-sigma B factor antagonist